MNVKRTQRQAIRGQTPSLQHRLLSTALLIGLAAGLAAFVIFRRDDDTSIWLSLVLGLATGVCVYLVANLLILNPIRRFTDKLESLDQADEIRPHAIPREFIEINEAFNALRTSLSACEQARDHLIHHDALTDLPNRVRFRGRLADAIETAKASHTLTGLLFIDLDRFKQVNDSYGHTTGDRMLQEVAQRLRKMFRQDDLIARLGGDEFAVLLPDQRQREQMTELAQKALSAIQRPYEIEGRLFHIGASIGIAVAPDDGTDPDRLIQLADAAMYAVKREEGSSLRFVSNDLTAKAAARHVLENELRDAVQHHQLALHYQPVIATDDGHIHCYESLLRWPHAEQGMLRPASFMNALNDAGLCTQISDWTLDYLEKSPPHADAVISTNLSARLLHDEAFAQRLFERLDDGGLIPRQLILEITEDTLETDLRGAARTLQKLKEYGVRIALDDFGTGQASLSHLRRFPFDYIKIDRSFTSGIGRLATDEKLVQAIIRLAHALDMRVVAEGVETEEQRDFLTAERCDYIQGYLVGKPVAGPRS